MTEYWDVCHYFHEKTVVFSDGNFADFAEVLDLHVFNLVHVRLVTKHLPQHTVFILYLYLLKNVTNPQNVKSGTRNQTEVM